MAPNLAASQHRLIGDMINSGRLTTAQMANVAGCSVRTVTSIRANLRCFGSTNAPRSRPGPSRAMSPPMIDALCQHLLEKPDQYLDEMVVFLWDEFNVLLTTPTVSRALKSIGWSRKAARRVAQQRNADLRDFYLHNLSSFRFYHLVYIDESGCDKRSGFRRRGWSPLGVTPVQIARLGRGQRYQILPAYCQDDILLARVFQGSTDATVFEDFIERLLHHCGRWPEPRSVLVMNNASFHYSERIEQMCICAGVKLVYLPPYSPDLNPIEEFFAELKSFIKRNWKSYEDDPDKDFQVFLEWCIDVVGSKVQNVQGHFRHAGLTIEQL